MTEPRGTRKSTLDHRQPALPGQGTAAGALIAVLPREIALPIPGVFAPVGRRWFAAQGVDDREISTRHVQLSLAGARWQMSDAGSRNGTWVDGRRLGAGERATLGDGTVLRLGRTLLVYRERLSGDRDPAAPVGGLVGPFGLRALADELGALARLVPDNVLLEGETGTGKELLAHEVAARLGRERPFGAVNVAAMPAGLFESLLFGHVAGAFSDARQASKGIVAAHEAGTVFLDELGELPAALQPKLLRLAESRELLPVGSDRPVRVDVLLVAATNRELEQLVAEGTFRRDLFARFSMWRLRLPPLRERREDVLAIARALTPRFGLDLDAAAIEVEAAERLLLEPWPTNVRGLMALLARVAAIDPAPGLRAWAVTQALSSSPTPPAGPPALAETSARAALETASGNESEAARRLGISRGKIRRLLGKA